MISKIVILSRACSCAAPAKNENWVPLAACLPVRACEEGTGRQAASGTRIAVSGKHFQNSEAKDLALHWTARCFASLSMTTIRGRDSQSKGSRRSEERHSLFFDAAHTGCKLVPKSAFPTRFFRFVFCRRGNFHFCAQQRCEVTHRACGAARKLEGHT